MNELQNSEHMMMGFEYEQTEGKHALPVTHKIIAHTISAACVMYDIT